MIRVDHIRHGACGVLLASSALLGCGPDPDDTKASGQATLDASGMQMVSGSIKEWAVELDAVNAAPGEITFTITNEGSIGHEFLVVRTDLAPGEIPVEDDRFSEENSSLGVIDEIGEFPKGETQTLTVTLEPGLYQMVCNLPGHYAAGMHTQFTVAS